VFYIFLDLLLRQRDDSAMSSGPVDTSEKEAEITIAVKPENGSTVSGSASSSAGRAVAGSSAVPKSLPTFKPSKVELPRLGRSFSVFATDIAVVVAAAAQHRAAYFQAVPSFHKIKVPNIFMWCVKDGIFGEIVYHSPRKGFSSPEFRVISPEELVTLIEDYVELFSFTKMGMQTNSMSAAQAKVLIASRAFRQALPKVNKILSYSIPLSIDSNPAARADYCELAQAGFHNYEDPSGETVHYYCGQTLDFFISLSEAKAVLESLYAEFGFVDDDCSKAHAIAHLITPFVQAIMGWRKRSPMWLFTADSPRSGKDYLAMISPIVHENFAIQDSPLEDESEVKRRITSSLVAGRRFMHFANCRGEVNSPSLEAAITAEYWSDRLIGYSTSVKIPNEILFSMSFNGELPMTLDLIARSRRVRLSHKGASANSRTFRVPNLHTIIGNYIPKKGVTNPRTALCQRNVIAALAALLKNWTLNKCPSGKTLTSYPEWSRVVGGIMDCAGLGDPCTIDSAEIFEGLSESNIALTRVGVALALETAPRWFTSQELLHICSANGELAKAITNSKAAVQRLGQRLASLAKGERPLPRVTLHLDDSDSSRPRYSFARKIDVGLEELKEYAILSKAVKISLEVPQAPQAPQ
jgi:hypothetical protein